MFCVLKTVVLNSYVLLNAVTEAVEQLMVRCFCGVWVNMCTHVGRSVNFLGLAALCSTSAKRTVGLFFLDDTLFSVWYHNMLGYTEPPFEGGTCSVSYVIGHCITHLW